MGLLKDVVTRVAERSGNKVCSRTWWQGLLKGVVTRFAQGCGMGLLKDVVARVAERIVARVCSRMWQGFAQGCGGDGAQ
jgi:hypothetical protein